jgi:hypothetical protein
MGNVETGEIEKFSGTQVIVKIADSEKSYNALIDLAEGKVTNITETAIDYISMGPSVLGIEIVTVPDEAS